MPRWWLNCGGVRGGSFGNDPSLSTVIMSFQWLAGLRRTPSLPTEGVVGLENCAVYSAEAESNRKIKRERKEGQRRSGFRVWFQHDLGGTAGPGGATASIRKAKASCFPRTSLRIGLGCFLLFILT